MKNIKFSLAWQILFAMVLGILLGSYLHYHSDSRDWLVVNLLSPAGDIFIHLIKMIVVPIVISTLVVGIAGVGDAKQLGRIGAKTIIYFEVITTVAIILGITLANVFQPGAGVDMSQLATVDISKYQSTTEAVQSSSHGIMGTILSLVPTNIVASMAKGEMLPIIFFSVLFGLGLSSLPASHREPLVTVFRSISETMFKVTHMVMRYAPVGVFALIAVTVANFGFSSLWPLAKLVLLVHFAILFFALVVLGIVARLCGLSVWILIRILKDELILAYSTASSESVLPRIIEKMEAYGAPASITSFVVPTGYSFNLDGSTLYQSIAAIFIAQLYGIDLSIWQEIILVLTLMVTSKGIAGVPGVSFECQEQNGSHINEDHFYPEIINPETLEQLPSGQQGELVFTTLTKEGMPLLRYRTKDLCSLMEGTCACGRTSVRMSRIMGRSDDMLIIRGINVFPSQVESVILGMPEFEPQYMLVVDRQNNLDILQVQVEVRRDFFSDDLGRMLAMKKTLSDKLKSVLSISADIKLMEPNSISRSEGKSKHVIDKRVLK